MSEITSVVYKNSEQINEKEYEKFVKKQKRG